MPLDHKLPHFDTFPNTTSNFKFPSFLLNFSLKHHSLSQVLRSSLSLPSPLKNREDTCFTILQQVTTTMFFLIFFCASISWTHIGEWVTHWVSQLSFWDLTKIWQYVGHIYTLFVTIIFHLWSYCCISSINISIWLLSIIPSGSPRASR